MNLNSQYLEILGLKISVQQLKTIFWLCVICFLFLSPSAHAVSTDLSADNMPWKTGMQTIVNSFTGPVPTVIAILGIVGSGAMLAFGAEISGITKSVLIIVLVVAILVNAVNLLSVIKGSALLLPSTM